MLPEIAEWFQRWLTQRPQEMDAEVMEWYKKHRPRALKKVPPSVRARLRGLRINREFALIQCPGCNFFSIARAGQKTKLCPRCGRRFWLAKSRPIAVSDDYRILRNYIPVLCHKIGAGLPWLTGLDLSRSPAGKGQCGRNNFGERPAEPAPCPCYKQAPDESARA